MFIIKGSAIDAIHYFLKRLVTDYLKILNVFKFLHTCPNMITGYL
jgi:hypothetical protein